MEIASPNDTTFIFKDQVTLKIINQTNKQTPKHTEYFWAFSGAISVNQKRFCVLRTTKGLFRARKGLFLYDKRSFKDGNLLKMKVVVYFIATFTAHCLLVERFPMIGIR